MFQSTCILKIVKVRKIYKQNIFHTVNKIMNLDVPGKWVVMYLCVRRHVFVCQRYRFCLFLRFWNLILELFRQCGIFCFSICYLNATVDISTSWILNKFNLYNYMIKLGGVYIVNIFVSVFPVYGRVKPKI